MKVRNPETGQFMELYVKSMNDTPVGAEIDYNGTEVPDGWEEIEDKGEVYSTEEVKVGTWIDGKPLYRKVITVNNIMINNTTTINTNISNLCELIKEEGLFIDGSNELYLPYPIYNNDGSKVIQMYVSKDGTKIRFRGSDSWSPNLNRTHKFILEYTKTTD